MNGNFREAIRRSCLGYLSFGWALTPLRPRDKRPYLPQWGKHPFRCAEDVERHWRERPRDNVGVILGAASGICDIEDDSTHARRILMRALTPREMRTPTFQSGKSLHRLFYLPREPRLGNVLAADDIEIRLGMDGQSQSVLPPSIHPTGRRYAWCQGLSPHEVEPRPCPESIIELVLERRAIQQECETAAAQGQRPVVVRLPPGDRPGDVFNAAASWEGILHPHGWRIIKRCNGLSLWRHPASESGSPSASTGYITAAGNDVLSVYSNRTPFRTVLHDHATYTKFHAFAVLNCDGDFRVAARRLAERGFQSEGRMGVAVYRILEERCE